MDLALAKKIIKKVQTDYDLIAKEWNVKRPFSSPYKIRLMSKIKPKQKILDAGCGNGILYDFLAKKSIDYTGLDVSAKLLKIAGQRIKKIKSSKKSRARLIKGEVLMMPFADKTFDWVVAFAVLHHLPKVFHEKAAREIRRVLKPGGRTVVAVWNLYSDYAEKKFRIEKQSKNLEIPWKATPGHNLKRYLYRFEKKELADLFKQSGFKKINCYFSLQTGQRTTKINEGDDIILTAQK